MKKEYAGRLILAPNGEADEILYVLSDSGVTGDPLAKRVEGDMWQHGRKLSVRYWIAPKPINRKLRRDMIIKEGEGFADFGHRYSEITGYLWTDEDLMVGGHDLIGELRNYVGQYVHLEITFSGKLGSDYNERDYMDRMRRAKK